MDKIKSIQKFYQGTMPEKIRIRNNQMKYFDQEVRKLMFEWKINPETKRQPDYRRLSVEAFWEKWGEYL